METNQYPILFKRFPKNPLLSAANWPYPVNTVFNPGATRLADGSTLLLCRVEDRRGHSHLAAARSRNGYDNWEVDTQPTLDSDSNHPEETWGLEDPRITYLPDLRQYAVVYTAFGPGGPGVALALTSDFKSFERYGVIRAPEDKDAALLPYQINGRWALIHRPVNHTGAHMWISYSPDLRNWETPKMFLQARQGSWWDANKIGLSTPPIKCDDGWLVMYHGVRHTAAGCLYRVGLTLFDHQLEQCMYRGDEWVFGPEKGYEQVGDVGNVVFPCGYTIADDQDTVNVYYGSADSSVCLATCSIQEMVQWVKTHDSARVARPEFALPR
jgi:predicted GH43/DUF377 family glycosyl hydrolase